MLKEEFLIPMAISQRDLADAIHVPYQRVNELVNKKRGITPSTALRLAKFFGVSADFWLNLQTRCWRSCGYMSMKKALFITQVIGFIQGIALNKITGINPLHINITVINLFG